MNETTPLATAVYKAEWPDRHELNDLLRLCSAVASGIRKPAVPLPFAPLSDALQKQIQAWMLRKDSERSDAQVAEIRENGVRLIAAVRVWVKRQRHYPFDRQETPPQLIGIGALDEDGLLQPGVHQATWQEFLARFATSEWRQKRVNSLLAIMHMCKQAGGTSIEIGGSLVTAKDLPGDIDCRLDSEALDWSKLDGILHYRSQPQPCTEQERQWRGLRREYFGADVGFAERELHRRTFREYDACGWSELLEELPASREVGVVRIDLREPLPAAIDFVPFAWARGACVLESMLLFARHRLPQHWEHITDDMLEAAGVRIIAEPWLRPHHQTNS